MPKANPAGRAPGWDPRIGACSRRLLCLGHTPRFGGLIIKELLA